MSQEDPKFKPGDVAALKSDLKANLKSYFTEAFQKENGYVVAIGRSTEGILKTNYVFSPHTITVIP